MEPVTAWVQQWHQWVFVGVLVLGALIINRIVRLVTRALARHAQPERKVWRNALWLALDAPLRVLVWILALYVGVAHFLPTYAAIAASVAYILVTLTVTWFALRMINRLKDNYSVRATKAADVLDSTAIEAVGKLAWAVVLILAVLVILRVLHVPLTGLLAFGGAAGIAIGFAAQSLVSNLFGGMTIFSTRIFKIGEDIVLPGTDLAGTVQNIGWRATRVLGWNGKPFFVPNSFFNTTTVINHSRMAHRTISENVLLRYEDFDKVDAIVRAGNTMLEQRDDIGYYVFRFASFGDNALELAIYAYAQTRAYAEFMRIKEEVLMSLAAIIREHDATLVLPLAHYVREGGGIHAPAATDGVARNDARGPDH